MTYDPNLTTVLPPVGYPITEELPAVRTRGPGPGGRGFLKIAAALLIAAIIAIAGVLIIDNQRNNQTATGNPDTTSTPITEPGATPAPTADSLDDANPGYWQVVGVPDGLNVRSGPGIDNDIVGSLRAGDRHIFATGETAGVNDAAWRQITFGDDDRIGWVSARFLDADTPPIENPPTPTPAPSQSTSVVCFQSQTAPTRLARIRFDNRTQISGVIRTVDGDTPLDQQISGTLANGLAQVTLTNSSTGQSSTGTWTFATTRVDLDTGTSLAVVDCASIAGQLP